MIKYLNGDLLQSETDLIVHGCNCFKTMGAGVAKAIKIAYPKAYLVDLANYTEPRKKLGTYTRWTGAHKFFPEKQITVVNMYTQYEYTRSSDLFEYESFRAGLTKLLLEYPTETIAMPKIGAGLAGGDWEKIAAIINEVSGEREIIVYELQKPEKHVGFTGTREGLTDNQLRQLRQLLRIAPENQYSLVAHHGDCVGADSEFHDLCEERGWKTVVHPPIKPELRAFKPSRTVMPSKDYLSRNRDIVDASTQVIACPKSKSETGGTWYTINYAKKAGHIDSVAIIYPEGTVDYIIKKKEPTNEATLNL
jgi:O-acetyl-ADP-ribose deacetylase (regulator of RNase III)